MRLCKSSMLAAVLLVAASANAEASSPAPLATVIGLRDTFSAGSTDGWTSGGANPTPPLNVASGGPAGASDGYLLLQSSGNSGPGGKLVAFGGPQWSGDLASAGIISIDMDVSNLGGNALLLRLGFDGAGATAISTDGVVVPAGSGWIHIAFAATPAALTGNGALALANLSGLRLFHSASAVFPGPIVLARLGIDNVTAVPEPGSALLLAAGAALLALRRQLSTRRSS